MENPTERLHANTLEDHASFGAPNEFSEIAGIAAPPTVKNERDEGHDAEEADVGGEAEEDDDEGRSEGKEADTHFMAPGGAANHVAEEEGVALACTSASNPSCEERCESQKQHLQRPLKRLRPSTAKERISKMPPCAAGKRSSIYRGVTRHRWTGRYEAHLWDKSTWNQTQNKKGKQVYLGAYDDEEAAARAYDLAALKYWGPGTTINFPVSDYARDIDDMQNVSREDYLASLRRRSSGFSRSSKAKGVCRSHTSIRWDSHIRGNFAGIPTINGYDSFGNGGLEYGILGCPQMGLINLCHFLNWLQPPSLSGDTHSNGSKRPLNLKHMEEDCLSEEQSSQRSTTGGEDHSDATCEQQQEKDKSSRPSWSCEPYQMLALGIRRKSRSSMSALAALSQSVMFQKMEQGLRGWRVPEQAEMRVSETATTALAEALAMDGLAELEEIENSTALHQSHEATARRICDSVQSPQEVESTSCSMDLHNSTPDMRKSSTRAGQMASCSDDHSRGDNVNMHSLLPPAPYIIDQQAAYLSDQLPGLWNAFYAPSSIGMIF